MHRQPDTRQPRILGPTVVGLVAQQDSLALQGSLFGEHEPAKETTSCPVSASNPKLSEQTDANLCADAAARPRRRRQPEPSAPSPNTASTPDDPEDDDLPPWAHHSQVDPQQLTPMLRHYVNSRPYPGGFCFTASGPSSASSRMRSALPLLGCSGKKAKPSAVCRWRASITPPSATMN